MKLDELNFDCCEKIFEYLDFVDIFHLIAISRKFIQPALYRYPQFGPKHIGFLTELQACNKIPMNRVIQNFGKYWISLVMNACYADLPRKRELIREMANAFKKPALRYLRLNNFPEINSTLELLFPTFRNLQTLSLEDVELPCKLSILLDNLTSVVSLCIRKCYFKGINDDRAHTVPELPNIRTLALENNLGIYSQESLGYRSRFPKIMRFCYTGAIESEPIKSPIIYGMPFLNRLIIDLKTLDAFLLLASLNVADCMIHQLTLMNGKLSPTSSRELKKQRRLKILTLVNFCMGPDENWVDDMLRLECVSLDNVTELDNRLRQIDFKVIMRYLSRGPRLRLIMAQNMPQFGVTPGEFDLLTSIIIEKPIIYFTKIALLGNTRRDSNDMKPKRVQVLELTHSEEIELRHSLHK